MSCTSFTTVGRWRLLHRLAIAIASAAACYQALLGADDIVRSEPADGQPADNAAQMPAMVIVGNNRVLAHNRVVIQGQVRQGLQLQPLVAVAAAAPTVDLGGLFDRMVFTPEIRGPQPSKALGLGVLRQRGEARIALFDTIVGLSPAQTRRLQLALASDFAEFATGYDTVRAKYSGIDMQVRPGGFDRDRIVALQADAARCRSQCQQLFGPTSLLGAVEHEFLDPAQTARLDTWVADQRATRWREMVERVLLKEDARKFWRSPDLAAEAVAVVAAAVPPLAAFDAACDPVVAARIANFEQVLVHLGLGQIDEHRLRQFVDPGQWARLRSEIDQAMEPGVGQVERELIARRVLEGPGS